MKFADAQNGLAAIPKVPAAGWGQILSYMASARPRTTSPPGTAASKGNFGFIVRTSPGVGMSIKSRCMRPDKPAGDVRLL